MTSQPGHFVTTQWAMVFQARDPHDPGAAQALDALCRAYWPPLYTFIRRQGFPPAEAQDLTQAFFERLLERDYLSRLQHQEGRFRSFLLTFLKHFLSEQRARASTQKRGGGQMLLSLDECLAEERHGAGPLDARTPDQAFERRWAERIMERTLQLLRDDYARAGQLQLFELLKDFQPRDPSGPSYADLAARLHNTPTAVKTAAHRLRVRHREFLRAEIAQTVASPDQIEDEIRYLREILSRPS